MYDQATPAHEILEEIAVKLVLCDDQGRPRTCRFLRLRDLLGFR